MKLSDYVMKFLVQKKVQHVFMLPGGGCMHLVDSLGRNKQLGYTTCLHEQAASIAAESYAQHTNNLGVCLVTTGPGGTNAMTGLAAAWIDSSPILFISGQVKRSDITGSRGVRQMGSQEVDIVSAVRAFTKYAITVMEPKDIRIILEKAYHEAMTGRRGPVWIDIPLDVQATEIDEQNLQKFSVPPSPKNSYNQILFAIKETLESAQRPLVLVGNGVKLAGMENVLCDFLHKNALPALLTWKTIDMLAYDNEVNFGCPGVMGHRYANFILQNADVLLILGSRLDSSLTAWNHENFAPKAKKIMIDIDANEIKKMDMTLEITLTADLQDIMPQMLEWELAWQTDALAEWKKYCKKLRDRYPAVTAEMRAEKNYVNAHAFIEELSHQLTPEDVLVPESSGGAGEITYQALQVKKGQKIKNAAGLGSMGFGLPYALGACIANRRRRTVLINGDGAFQLNIQELATIAGNKLPIKIFIWENGGYASIQSTQRNFFDGNYVGASKDSKLYIPDMLKVAAAYGLKTFQLKDHSDIKEKIATVLAEAGPVLCTVKVSPTEIAMPRVKSVKLPNGNMESKPLEDMWPFLSQKELQENMWE